MSGHSHFHSIKHKKALEDEKRGKIFSKISRLITIAVKEKGGDPNGNPRLRLAIEQAKSFNMPKDKIERAIKKGTGELTGEKLEEFTFEAYGPGGIAIIIEGITDNKNRALNEIKQILSQNKGKLAEEGSVKWLFERKGEVRINFRDQTTNYQKKEDIELAVIEAGVEDIYWQDDVLIVYTKPNQLETVKKNLEEKAIKIESSSLGWVAKETIDVDEQKEKSSQKLFELLDENEAVQDIYSNLKN